MACCGRSIAVGPWACLGYIWDTGSRKAVKWRTKHNISRAKYCATATGPLSNPMSLLFNSYSLARPALFSLDAETAHELTLSSLQKAYDCRLTRQLLASRPSLPAQLMGMSLRNPVGLAAGLDKN